MDIHNEECKQPMLERQSQDAYGQAVHFNHALRHEANTPRRGRAVSLAIMLLLSYIAILQTIILAAGPLASCGKCETTSVIENELSLLPPGTLKYEERMEWTPFAYPWTTPPSPELDNVWEDLLYASNLRVTKEELEWLGENVTDRIQVDGGDYAAITGIIHHLHCLNNIRKVVHWDYYGPLLAHDSKIPPEMLTKEHSDHCIDAIRQALMCHANTALYTSEWLDNRLHPVSQELKSTKQATCLKWDTLDHWARQRTLVPGQYHFLSGPYATNVVAE